MNYDNIESPCVNICILNPDQICMGCGRSLDEITNWNKYTDEERSEIMKTLKT